MKDDSVFENKLLTRNTLFSYFNNYANLFFQIISSFLIARLLSLDLWGYLILSISIITLITIFGGYLPPALEYSTHYYVSRELKKGEYTKAKKFIKRALLVKFLFLSILLVLSIGIFIIFNDFFSLILNANTNLLFILSPLIIIIGFNPLLYNIDNSFNMYNLIFFLTLISSSFQISSYLLILLLKIDPELELLAIINVLTSSIPFIINFSIILKKYRSFDKTAETTESLIDFLKNTSKYGYPLSFGFFVYGFWDQIQIQGVNILDQPELVTGYKISLNYSNISRLVLMSISSPLITSFSRLESIKKTDHIENVYKFSIRYSLFLLLLISGGLIIFSEFFLYFIYGEPYLKFTIILNFMAFSAIFRIIMSPLEALLLARNHVIKFIPIKLVVITINLICFFPGLILYGLEGASFSLIIANIIILIFYMYLNKVLIKIDLNYFKLILQYSTFFISLIISLLLENFIYNDINFFLSKILNFHIFNHLHLFAFITFSGVYILMNIILKIFTKEDIENFALILGKNSKLLRIFKKIL